MLRPKHTVHKSAFLLITLGLGHDMGVTKIYMTIVASQQELVEEDIGCFT